MYVDNFCGCKCGFHMSAVPPLSTRGFQQVCLPSTTTTRANLWLLASPAACPPSTRGEYSLCETTWWDRTHVSALAWHTQCWLRDILNGIHKIWFALSSQLSSPEPHLDKQGNCLKPAVNCNNRIHSLVSVKFNYLNALNWICGWLSKKSVP